ncbi:MAG: TetR/AcrR family transcriptional regulator [Planctomycetota bacterium]
MGKEPPARSAADLLGAPVEPKNARDRLLLTAIDLFYKHGFHAIGLDRVIAEVGVTKTTFYKHFESKDDLILQAVRARDEWESEAWGRAVTRMVGEDPRAQLLGLFDVFDVWFNDPDFIGCIFINTAAEFPNPNDPVHRAAAEHKRKNRDVARDQAAAAGAKDPEAFADVYTMLVEGTLILRQVHLRNDAAKLARPVVEKLLADSIPG